MSEQPITDCGGSSEETVHAEQRSTESDWKIRWGAYLVAASGLLFVGNGAAMIHRVYFTSGFEPGVHDLGGVTRPELAETSPAIESYISHLHVNVAGLMVPVGVAMVALAWYGVRRGQQWAWATAIALPVLFLAHSIPVHQTVDFSFHTLQHLGLAALGGPILLAGAVLGYQGLR